MKKLKPTTKITTKDGTTAFYWNGKFHNWDGPAFIPEGDMRKAEYYIFGIKYSKLDFALLKRDVNGVPFYKTTAGKSLGVRI